MHRIRVVIDSVLLDALSINKTEIVLSFAHLAVGGAYLPATNSTHLLASIRILTNGGVAVDVGGGEGDVVVEADGNSTVQVKDYYSPNYYRIVMISTVDTTCI